MKETFCIGVSGHQNLGNEETVEFVGNKFRELLLTYRVWAEQHDRELVAYSALAVGADQLFVTIALDLNIQY